MANRGGGRHHHHRVQTTDPHHHHHGVVAGLGGGTRSRVVGEDRWFFLAIFNSVVVCVCVGGGGCPCCITRFQPFVVLIEVVVVVGEGGESGGGGEQAWGLFASCLSCCPPARTHTPPAFLINCRYKYVAAPRRYIVSDASCGATPANGRSTASGVMISGIVSRRLFRGRRFSFFLSLSRAVVKRRDVCVSLYNVIYIHIAIYRQIICRGGGVKREAVALYIVQ